MIFAIRGLLSIRAHFRQMSLREIFFNWLKRFPSLKRNNSIALDDIVSLTMTPKSKFEVWNSDNSDAAIDKRIEDLVKNLERIRNEQRNHADSIDELCRSHEKYKKKITQQAKKIEGEIRADFESVHTSDLIPSLVGLVWLTVGITMSTMAPEIYQWLK